MTSTKRDKAEMVEIHERQVDDQGNLPCILFMDSLNMHPCRKIHTKLRGYLAEESKAVRKRLLAAAATAAAAAEASSSSSAALTSDTTSSTNVVTEADADGGDDATENNTHSQATVALPSYELISDVDQCTMPSVTVRMPAQGNGYDCGMYVSQYAKYFTEVIFPIPLFLSFYL